MSRRKYYRLSIGDLGTNFVDLWPMWVGLLVWWLISSALFYLAESGGKNTNIHAFTDALYLTWMTMVTVGNLHPVTGWGEALSALDAVMGLILFGGVIWLVTTSIDQG